VGNSSKEELNQVSKRKQIEIKLYPSIKWLYFKGYSLYGYYWGYKLIIQNYELPYWEQWALWVFAMMSLYFFGRDERLFIK